jgi:dUTP pyrophosphatase
MNLKISVLNKSNNSLPNYETINSSGLDLKAFIEKEIVLKPLDRALVPTGLYISIPSGFEAQVRPRSGLAIKHGLTVLNTPGTIDADYRGEIKVILVNLSNNEFIIRSGERICQLVFSKVEQIEWKIVDLLDETDRGAGGFGHTGIK